MSKENLINNWIRKCSFKDDLVQRNCVVCYMHYRRKHSVKKAMLRYFFFFTATLVNFTIHKFSGDKFP